MGHPEYKNGAFAQRTGKVYEPWFKLVHGEKNELPGALPDPPVKERIIVIVGATSSQGGGVVNVMRKTQGGSDAAEKLTIDGFEVVQANFDDEKSLKKAFETDGSLSGWENRVKSAAILKSDKYGKRLPPRPDLTALGDASAEFPAQFNFGDMCDPRSPPEDYITLKGLGIDENEGVG
ncbi:hypothetical protein N0V90_005297 [Kalmusia sp. IMI 367209]|nr:hypothetical protein N0V90_005297 [Kalmusia sp. IMI 367209]